ncbi:MAG TPA: tRNA guanosine(34) transglycosylase Tgt [Candidatus Paceibacterota bacterium]|nr:tRNA guanosine(34) transglycosylase Tgt [Candidatus Paceibacterota bacterium]
MKRPISFEIEKRGAGLARAGVLKTPHGEIKTPAFIGVATKATLKGILPGQFSDLGVQGIIANTYHLYLSPGEKLIEHAGGIHRFMAYNGPIMTDSGGFQVFSLGEGFGKKISKFSPRLNLGEVSEVKPRNSPVVWDEDLATSHGKLAVVDDEGVSFTSHIDGSLHRFTPERSIEIQHALGADIIYAFDECTSPTADYAYQKDAMDRTHAWAKRSLAAHRQNPAKDVSQGIYGITQGGRFEDLRIESAKTLAEMDFDGYGIGGSFSKEDILGILELVNKELPEDKPRHLLGIGEPEDLFIGAEAGIDTFDCVIPTRKGRTGCLYTHGGQIIIRNTEFKDDFSAVDEDCDCYACKDFTRAYIHHLFRAGEMLGPMLATAHNVYFLAMLADKIRHAIIDNNLENFKDSFMSKYMT